MSYLSPIPPKTTDKISISCDRCDTRSTVLYISAKRNYERNGGQHICPSCVHKEAASKKPQNNKSYWTLERKAAHSQSVRNSDKYYESLKHRDTSGPKNGMYGKPAPALVKLKNSLRQKGKYGDQAIAWKGGKTSLTRRVKKYIHREHRWYYNVYRRDGFKCTKCGSKTKIDAHHIKPIVAIIKDLCANKTFTSDSEKFLFLISQPEIVDTKLENGMTLCRECHKKEHLNWGSHTPKANN